MWKVFLPWLAEGRKYSLRGFEKLSPDWPKEFNIFWRCEKFFCPGWLKEENIPWEGLKNSLLIGRKNLIFSEGVKSISALAGWRNKIFFERVWKALPWLVGKRNNQPTSLGRVLHTLSKNIFSSFQPARAELLHTLSKIILFLLYNQPGQSFYTPYQRIFFLLPISQGIAFTHPLKEYFYNLNWNVKRTNDQAFRLSSRNDLAVEIRSQISDSHIPGQLLSNGQMSLTNQYKYKLKSKKKFKNIINNILYSWCNKNIVMLCSLTFLSRSII